MKNPTEHTEIEVTKTQAIIAAFFIMVWILILVVVCTGLIALYVTNNFDWLALIFFSLLLILTVCLLPKRKKDA